ncbi:hypothetical protein GLYMA_09G113500v4 [Glycine max]|nr:hypothetical protein GLYMA_09G113500v4 [Glycine max]KAH1042541.1 hypothetical protein GYH30_024715 [Glycine max]
MLKEMDDSHMLTLVIQEMSKEFPTFMESLVHERDQYVEELVRLPDNFHCCTPSPKAGPVCLTPALCNGFVTFGSFNNLAKLHPSVRQRFLSTLEKLGLEPLRVDILPLILLNHDHMQAYSLMDISLDTFSYAGTTTTCEYLYMGVPCVTMVGSHAYNVGVSLLSKVGEL